MPNQQMYTGVCERDFGGGVRRFHDVSDAFVYNKSCWCVCAPSPSLPWHALWKTEEWSSTQDLQCVSVWLFSV